MTQEFANRQRAVGDPSTQTPTLDTGFMMEALAFARDGVFELYQAKPEHLALVPAQIQSFIDQIDKSLDPGGPYDSILDQARGNTLCAQRDLWVAFAALASEVIAWRTSLDM